MPMPGVLQLAVEDDGIGIGDGRMGGGLNGLRDRLDALDGTLSVVERPGGGTQLTASLPSRMGASSG